MGPIPEFDDPNLGHFKRTRLVNGNADEYQGTLRLGAHDVEVTLMSNDKRDLSPTLEHARSLYARLPAVMERVGDFAAEKYVKEYNEIWRTEDDDELTRETFLAQLVLAQLMIDPDGSVTMWFNDDEDLDLFAGHFIEVRLNAADGITSSDLLG